MAFVADNSVVTAWLTESQATAYTRQLLTRSAREEIHVPAVWPLEFINTLWVMQQRQIMQPHQVDANVAQAHRLGIVIDTEPVKPAALLAVMRRAGLSAYDASYLELAERRGWPLATRDRPMQRAAQRLGVPLA